MKFRSGNSYQNKIVGEGDFQNYICYGAREKKRGARNQKRYRAKVREVNEVNAKFMAFAAKQAPWLVERFFAENKVSNINKRGKITTETVFS